MGPMWLRFQYQLQCRLKQSLLRRQLPIPLNLLYLLATHIIPCFTATGPGYGILLNAGAIFRNSAAVSSGVNLVVADSFRINNGGRYIHNTRASHAGNISQALSRGLGTENGSFEFDVPGGAYTTSITNRVYGNLIFSATASGGSQSYNSIAANPCTIKGDLQINDGVIFNIDLTNTFTINRDLLMQNSMFNLASQPNNTRYIIRGNITLSQQVQLLQKHQQVRLRLNWQVTKISKST